eukprot:1137841-Pelagomonas_calceolata.AAC.11
MSMTAGIDTAIAGRMQCRTLLCGHTHVRSPFWKPRSWGVAPMLHWLADSGNFTKAKQFTQIPEICRATWANLVQEPVHRHSEATIASTCDFRGHFYARLLKKLA